MMKPEKLFGLAILACMVAITCGCTLGSPKSPSSIYESIPSVSYQAEHSGPVDDYIYVVSRGGESQAVGFHEEAALQEEVIEYQGHKYSLIGTVTFYDDGQDPRDYANRFAGHLMYGEVLLLQSQGDGATVFGRYERCMAVSQSAKG